MKIVKRLSKNQWNGAVDAVKRMIETIDNGETVIEFNQADWKMVAGQMFLTVAGERQGATIWTDGTDFYAIPDWMMDYGYYGNDWSSTSANGVDFTYINDEIVIAE